MTTQLGRSLGLALCLLSVRTAAFDGYVASDGPLTTLIAPLPLITNYDQPQPIRVTVSNTGPHSLTVSLVLAGLVDECRAIGETRKVLRVPAQSTGETEFALAVGRGACSALYPVRIDATATNADGSFPRQPPAHLYKRLLSAPATPGGNVRHSGSRRGRFAAGRQEDSACRLAVIRPAASGPRSRLDRERAGLRGSRRLRADGSRRVPSGNPCPPSLLRGPGTVFVAYRLAFTAGHPAPRLPPGDSRSCRSRTASDGVTAFRVRVNGEPLFERHTDNKVWMAAQVDLARSRSGDRSRTRNASGSKPGHHLRFGLLGRSGGRDRADARPRVSG